MNVGNSVRKSIDDWETNEHDSAMLHACNAIDGTAKKVYPALGSNARFTKLLRDNYAILGPLGMPGITLTSLRHVSPLPSNAPRPLAAHQILLTLSTEFTDAATGMETSSRRLPVVS